MGKIDYIKIVTVKPSYSKTSKHNPFSNYEQRNNGFPKVVMTSLKVIVTQWEVNHLLANNTSYETICSVFVSDEIRGFQVNCSNSVSRETNKWD